MNIVENKRKFFALVLSGSIIAICFILLVGFSVVSYFGQLHSLKNEITASIQLVESREAEIESFILEEQKKQEENFKQSQEEIEIDNILSSIKDIWDNPQKDIEINPYFSGEKSMSLEPFSDAFPFLEDPVVITGSGNTLLSHSQILAADIPMQDISASHNGFSSNLDYVFYKHPFGEDKKIIVLKNIEYTRQELFKNIMDFILLLIISWLVLFILCYFIAKIVLKPIEENIEEMEFFIDNAGHELKTPLAVIQSSGGLMKEMNTYNDELLGEIIGETKKAGQLIDGLRSLSKLTHKKEISLCNLREIIEIINKKYDQNDITITLHGEHSSYYGNQNHLRILFSNLIGNAVKYNQAGGKIDIYLEDRKVIISDTGLGIPKKEIKKIFSRFYRVKDSSQQREGFGLGLAMVKKICDIYGYKISVQSEENSGSQFTLLFPKKIGKN